MQPATVEPFCITHIARVFPRMFNKSSQAVEAAGGRRVSQTLLLHRRVPEIRLLLPTPPLIQATNLSISLKLQLKRIGLPALLVVLLAKHPQPPPAFEKELGRGAPEPEPQRVVGLATLISYGLTLNFNSCARSCRRSLTCWNRSFSSSARATLKWRN